MRDRLGKLDVRFLAFFSGVLLMVVIASLILFPEWRESPAALAALLVLAAVGVVGFAANFRAAFMPDTKDATPVALDYDSPQHHRNQANVIASVRASYIDGVLHEALGERVRLELTLDDRPETLHRPIVLVEGRQVRRALGSSAEVATVFRRSGQALLILGAPGSGKTITLLELCEPLLEQAEADPREPVPVVLNLSTWAQQQPPFAEWITEEMWRQYGLGKHVTPVWLDADHLILLLDGLDEVRPGARDACVRAINAFRETHGAGMVVCSRSADYSELAERLALRGAVEILPLDEAQIEAYLGDERLGLAAVREAIASDDALRELAQTPLMLSILAVAYGGRSLAELLPLLGSEPARRAHLYEAYIERAFERRPLVGVSYNAAGALRWLRFLARQMIQHNETQFFIEDLQPGWLLEWPQRRFRLVAGVVVGVVVGVVFSVAVSVLDRMLLGVGNSPMVGRPFSALSGVVVGVLFGYRAATKDIEPVDQLEIDFSPRAIGRAMKDGLLVGVLFGVLGGVVGGVLDNLFFKENGDLFGPWFYGALTGVLLGGQLGVLLGVLLGVPRDLLRSLESKRRNRPNLGIHRSGLNAMRGGMLFGVLAGILFGVLAGILFGGLLSGLRVLFSSLDDGLYIVLFGMLGYVPFGVPFGVLFGVLIYGGEAVVKHYVLRLLLHVNTLLPLSLVPFLEAMRARVLVQRAGAHYRFVHHTFQEHIAALTDERIERLTRA
jgi:hypothetical protein